MAEGPVQQQDIAAPAPERARVVPAPRASLPSSSSCCSPSAPAGRSSAGWRTRGPRGRRQRERDAVREDDGRARERRQSEPGTARNAAGLPAGAACGARGRLRRRWTKDIGSHVAKGELLAVIESPEIDQQLSQAEAARQQAAASLALTRSTVERWEALRKQNVVSQQELDERRSAVAQAEANLAAAHANVQRLRQLQGFTRVVAPFDGIITRRSVEVGDLVDSSGRTLFVLTQMDPLRVYVNVPQTYAQLVRPGQKVVVTQAELRGRTFAGEVARTAASIDPATRTMQVEIPCPTRRERSCPARTSRSSCRSPAARR